MASWSSNLVDNLTEGIHNIKCKDCDCFFEYESIKAEAAMKKYSWEKVFWKYVANLQENTHAQVSF